MIIDEKSFNQLKNTLYLLPLTYANGFLLTVITKRQKRLGSYSQHKTWVSAWPWQERMSYKREVWRKGNPLTLLVGMQTSTATMENSVEIS